MEQPEGITGFRRFGYAEDAIPDGVKAIQEVMLRTAEAIMSAELDDDFKGAAFLSAMTGWESKEAVEEWLVPLLVVVQKMQRAAVAAYAIGYQHGKEGQPKKFVASEVFKSNDRFWENYDGK